MSCKKSRDRMLVGLGAVAGVFGVAAMVSAGTAPAACADATSDATQIAIQSEENSVAYEQAYLASLPQSEQVYLDSEYTQLSTLTDQLETQEDPAFPDNDLTYDWMFSPASYASDPYDYANSVFSDLWSPLETLGKAAGLDYGAAGPIAGVALGTQAGQELLDHLPGALAGTNALDAVHAWIEMPEFLFTAGGVAADAIPGAQPAGLAFDAFATGLNGLDTLVTNIWG